jgi:hypothetical protein
MENLTYTLRSFMIICLRFPMPERRSSKISAETGVLKKSRRAFFPKVRLRLAACWLDIGVVMFVG